MNVQSGISIGMVVSVEHAAYNDLVTEPLGRLRDTWGNPDSVMSILLACTYSVLSNAAVATNYSIKLGEERKVKFRHHPKVKQAEKLLLASILASSSVFKGEHWWRNFFAYNYNTKNQ